MKLHDLTENGAIDPANINKEITTSMKEASAHHNGGIFQADAHNQEQIQRLTLKSNRKDIIGKQTLERKWTMGKDKPKVITRDNSTQIENILNMPTENSYDIQLTQSDTNLLREGLNFCPTPPPPEKYDINKDINAFARRLTVKEYHTPENIEDIIDDPGYQLSILQN